MQKMTARLAGVMVLAFLSLLVFTGCSKSSDSNPGGGNTSALAVGIYSGKQLVWWDGNTKMYDGAATIKITDLGNNKVRVESAEPSLYNFPVKEFTVQMVSGKIMTGTSENISANNLIITTTVTPAQLYYGINFNGDLLTFDGVKN